MLQLPRLAGLTLLQRHFHIRRGDDVDVSMIAALIRAQERRWRGCLGSPHYPSLRKAAAQRRLHIALLDGNLVGFVEFYRRRDGGQTIYSLAVDGRYEGLGIGRNLLYSVECPIRLKCPRWVNGHEPNPANSFYANAGLHLSSTHVQFNTWELSILPILIQGTNYKMPEIARCSGWAYGTRATEKPRDWCFQVDIEWRDYSWADYLRKIEAWQPFAALVPDYEHAEQRRTLLNRIEHLKRLGVQKVLVCPKFAGAVADIPLDCIVAVSIPSSYAGFVPDYSELRGRKVHLLGGSPPKWFGSRRRQNNATGYIAALQGAGVKVISVDGNAHTKAAVNGGIWAEGVWEFKRTPLDIYGFMVESGLNIARDLHQSNHVMQMSFNSELFIEQEDGE